MSSLARASSPIIWRIEVESSTQNFQKHDIKIGLSDGIKVEVLSGVTLTDKIKIPENAGPAGMEGSGAGSNKGPGKPPPKK